MRTQEGEGESYGMEAMNGASAGKILILTDDFGGGTGNHLLSMIRHWDRSKWNVRIMSQARLTARVEPDVPVTYLRPLGRFDVYPLGQARRLNEIRRHMRAAPPDLVHAYFFWSIIYARILKRLGLIRFLVENREDQGFNWGGHEYSLLRLTGNLPDRVICVSSAVRDVVLEREGLAPGRTVVIHNGIVDASHGDDSASGSDSVSIRSRHSLPEDALIVGMVANLNRAVKGVGHFLDAIPLIIKEVPASRFVIIGRGRDEVALREKAETLGIAPYVVFAGYRNDVGRYYSEMDVSVLTSLSEGLSITLLESMNHRIPVVATRVGGNPEVVMDGCTGFLVPPGDPVSFASRVVELLRNRELRVRMGEAGYRRTMERFRIDEASRRYLEIYSDLLGK